MPPQQQVAAPTEWTLDQFYGGISDSEKLLVRSAYYQEKEYHFFFGQNANILGDPGQVTIQPAAVKESGSTITALPKWIVSGNPFDTNTYIYDAAGNIYKRTSAGAYSLLRAVSNSVGQGLGVYNDYLYYVQNTQVGRYGPLSGSPTFTDAWQTGLTDTSALGFAPVKEGSTGLSIGHGNNLAFWDGTVWTLAKLVLPPQCKIRSLEEIDEYVVMGVVTNTSYQSGNQGYLFFWDGVSQQFNYNTPMDGGVGALLNNKNRLLTSAGQAGYLFVDSQPAKKLGKVTKLKAKSYAEVYPGAVTNYQELACLGLAANTDSTDLVQGVYQWGARSDAYPEGFNMAYTLSTGHTTSISIGALCGIGNVLLVGWQDGASFGIDKIDRTGSPYATATIESTIIDDKHPAWEKQALTINVTHLPLKANETIQLGYKIDRATSYTLSTANSTVGSVVTKLSFTAIATRFHEFQFEAILGATGSTAPYVTSMGLTYNALNEEGNY